MDAKFKPSKLYFRHVKDAYSLRKYGSSGFRVEDYTLKKLLSAAYGATAWARSKQGVEWAFEIVGIEKQFAHDGFNYFVLNGDGERKSSPIPDNKGLTIYRVVDRGEPDAPQSAIDAAKRVVYVEGWELPDDSFFNFTIGCYKTWFRKNNGIAWLSEFVEPVKMVSEFHKTAYRYDSNGKIYWFPDDDVYTSPGESVTCEGCDMDMPCTDNYSGLGTLCVRCYAENFADEEVLKACTREECKDSGCPNYMSRPTFERLSRDSVTKKGKYGLEPREWSA